MTESKPIVNVEVKKQIRPKNNINVFKIKCIFDERGESLESAIERAFGSYCSKRI